MPFKLMEANNITYLECNSPEAIIQNEQDILDLVAACGDYETDKVIIHQRNLSPGFFDLKTGLAGTLFQKFANYRIKGAAVILLDNIKSQRFKELIFESNKGSLFRFFEDRESAVMWLISVNRRAKRDFIG